MKIEAAIQAEETDRCSDEVEIDSRGVFLDDESKNHDDIRKEFS